MPNVQTGETEKKFVSRCIPYVLDKDKNVESASHAAAICHGIYKQYRKNKQRRAKLRKCD